MAQLMKPLLSICIPTYNRSEQLKKTLDSIVEQPEFIESNDIEVVVSDNYSNDDTPGVMRNYKKKYGKKIIYNRNSENIHDKNFKKALSLGNGEYLKLYNDTLIMNKGSLHDLLELIKKALKEKPVLFFANGAARQKNKQEAFSSFEFFIESASFNVTWIGAFGIWKKDFYRLTDFDRAAELQLMQVDVLFRMFEFKKNSIIDNSIYFTVPPVQRKGGYDSIKVFSDNYFELLQTTVQRGDLTLRGYKKEQKRILFNFIIPWLAMIYNDPDKYYFDVKDWSKRLRKYYPFYILWYAYILYLIRIIFQVAKKILKKIKNRSLAYSVI